MLPNVNQALYSQLVLVEALSSYLRDNMQNQNLDKSLIVQMDKVIDNVHSSIFMMKESIERIDNEVDWKQLFLDL